MLVGLSSLNRALTQLTVFQSVWNIDLWNIVLNGIFTDGATFVGDTVSGRGNGLMVNLLLSAASRPQTNFSAFYIATSTGMGKALL